MSIHFLSRISTWMDEFTTDFGFGLAFATSSLCCWTAQRSQWVFLLTFLWRNCGYHSQCEPMRLFGLQTIIQSFFQCKNVLREDRVSHPRLGRSSYLNESTLSVGMLWGFEAECTLDMLSEKSQILPLLWWRTVLSQSSLRIQHLCNVSTISDLQEVLRISWDNFATSFPVPRMKSSFAHFLRLRRYWADWQK